MQRKYANESPKELQVEFTHNIVKEIYKRMRSNISKCYALLRKKFVVIRISAQ